MADEALFPGEETALPWSASVLYLISSQYLWGTGWVRSWCEQSLFHVWCGDLSRRTPSPAEQPDSSRTGASLLRPRFMTSRRPVPAHHLGLPPTDSGIADLMGLTSHQHTVTSTGASSVRGTGQHSEDMPADLLNYQAVCHTVKNSQVA